MCEVGWWIISTSLVIDKGEWLEDIEIEDNSSASFLTYVEECISEGEIGLKRYLILKLKKYIFINGLVRV